MIFVYIRSVLLFGLFLDLADLTMNLIHLQPQYWCNVLVVVQVSYAGVVATILKAKQSWRSLTQAEQHAITIAWLICCHCPL